MGPPEVLAQSHTNTFNHQKSSSTHPHALFHTAMHKISTQAARQTQCESDLWSSLSHRLLLSHSHSESEREMDRKATERQQREKRIRTALVCLREMMDEVERCDDLAHRSNSQWETTYEWHLFLARFRFKWNPTIHWQPAQSFFRTLLNLQLSFIVISEILFPHKLPKECCIPSFNHSVMSVFFSVLLSSSFFPWTVVGGCHCCKRGDDWLSGIGFVCVMRGGWDLLGKIS